MNYTLPNMPERSVKPRKSGITMVMDKGLSRREAEDLVSVSGDYTDYIKLGFGTSLLTPGVEDKIKVFKDSGIDVYLGGTLFEACIVRNAFDDFLRILERFGVSVVEVSDGSYEFDHDLKLDYIRRLSADYTVISEVGSKKKDVIYPPEEWVSMMHSELQAGSVKVIAEARESGTTGIYNDDGSVNNDLIEMIAAKIGLDSVIWEAPLKSQQAWFINEFGAEVNLGNIAPDEVIALEALRNGLRGDTFFRFLPENMGR